MSRRYEESGVDLEKGYESVERIKKHIKRTENMGVMGGIGAFGGLFDLAKYNYEDPVLVSGTDGVGTKLQLAIDYNKHETIGIDLVAMCVNDIITQNAKPLFFLDYLAVGKNNPLTIEKIVAGISDGCVISEMALIGGETAEMPGMYAEDSYDLAGFAVGCAERSMLPDTNKVEAGNVLLGFHSSGFHSNGYSLIRNIIETSKVDMNFLLDAKTVIDHLMTPTKIYVKEIEKLKTFGIINSMMHITGGGFEENIPRGLPEGFSASIDMNTWPIPKIITYIQEQGNLSDIEMMQVFNYGIGFICVVSEDVALSYLKENDDASIIGRVTLGETLEYKV